MKMKKILIILLTAALFCAGCSADQSSVPDKITVLLDWTPNTNYSGVYAAIDQQYYINEGLEVEVIQAPGSVVTMVAAGQAQFGFSYQEEVTYARISEIPVVSVAAVIQHNTSGFASLKEKAIETPADFEGKSYGGWGSPVEEAMIKTLMDRYAADFTTVDMITTGEVDSLLVIQQEADFAWIYYGWAGVEAELKGMDLNFIELGRVDPALDYYTPVIITSEKLIAENPDLVERFMRATAKGYKLAIDDPAAAAAALITHAPELDPELVNLSQEWLADKYQGDAETWGLQQKETWEAYSRWLYDYGLVDQLPDMENAFTNRFLR
jgi:ABC-type nitrate/sulfonate/bicarbonate transport system substrate-binding protein